MAANHVTVHVPAEWQRRFAKLRQRLHISSPVRLMASSDVQVPVVIGWLAVIVSGYDGGGAAAPCGIKEVGGITIAQKPETAKQPDMPGSAIASGCIDFVLSPEDIAGQIVRIAARARSEAQRA